jgi:hypothetical protein
VDTVVSEPQWPERLPRLSIKIRPGGHRPKSRPVRLPESSIAAFSSRRLVVFVAIPGHPRNFEEPGRSIPGMEVGLRRTYKLSRAITFRFIMR